LGERVLVEVVEAHAEGTTLDTPAPLLQWTVAVAQTGVCPGWLRRFRDGAELHRV
jgi:hypothetical protein